MNIKTNSKYVKKKDIFVCIHDEFEDRHKYIKDIKKASAIIVDKDVSKKNEIPFVKVLNTNDALFDIYNTYYEKPLEDLTIMGITGTDGKTTTSIMIKDILNNIKDTGYLGTNGFICKDIKLKTKNTTPAIDSFMKYASILKNNKVNNLIMEMSSEGLLHNRCNNIKLERAIITNVTGDHLNIHKNFDNYLAHKLKIFDLLSKDGVAIVNKDDCSYKYIKNKRINMVTYGTCKGSHYRILNIKETSDKTFFDIKHKGAIHKVESPFLGIFNVYNLTCAIATVNSFDIDIEEILSYIKDLKPVSGRMNIFYNKNGSRVILDYAHTKNATLNILEFANRIKKGKIITVVGSAGGREKEKRKDIGRIVTDLSDKVIFTMDDPRYEKVKDINDELTSCSNNKNYIYIKNRKKAIKKAIQMGQKDDLILILGKGTDNYMAIKNKYKKYSDFKTIKKYI